MSVLEISGLTAGYHRSVPTILDVAATITSGETVAVIGPNGAGKSTFIKAIFGLCTVHAGRVELDGTPLVGLPASKVVAHGLAYVPQVSNVFPTLTVKENLEMGGFLARRQIRERLAEVTDLFPDLTPAMTRKAEELSGGQRNMLALARALMTRPSFVLLDEPTAGLSPLYVERVWAQVGNIGRSGVGVLIVEQNAHRALQAAQRGIVLVEGRVALANPSPQLLSSPEVVELYLGGEASVPRLTGSAS